MNRTLMDVDYSEIVKTAGLAGILLCILLLFPFTDLRGMEKGDPARGKASFNKRTCAFCHTLNGRGGDVGPDLTNIKERRSDEWLFKWLKDPPSVKPDTIMPKMKWESDQEIIDVIYYLKDPG